ncbi:MAG: rRNA pseudouridine synthase [candidate division SR1 bacterium]|nr:rRNA pseudouridine synthase [candidate division SR1 bacterium]
MRINKFLAQSLGLSRRNAESLVVINEVKVNGEIAKLFTTVENKDKVEYIEHGKWITLGSLSSARTVVMYKQIFCVTTRDDEVKRKTIYHFLPKSFLELKSAGRLDYMSEGLLVLSNDGDLIYNLTHPSNESKKVYLVGIKGSFKLKEIEEMGKGIVIEKYNLNPVEVEKYEGDKFDYLRLQPSFNWYTFTLTEGRNNQIRKMTEYYGYTVQRLIRVEHGKYKLTAELYKKKWLEKN